MLVLLQPKINIKHIEAKKYLISHPDFYLLLAVRIYPAHYFTITCQSSIFIFAIQCFRVHADNKICLIKEYNGAAAMPVTCACVMYNNVTFYSLYDTISIILLRTKSLGRKSNHYYFLPY
ncbi:hypothetical protein IV01_22450 [Pseudomonas syringae]|uniref:Uncharacterized protein n=1 Tax=Pseudomonas syringae TaxID=317 RepID=A0A085V9S2_PSESX|nr:hypothetical protein IV01_22450 [Pseudomonas syringae]